MQLHLAFLHPSCYIYGRDSFCPWTICSHLLPFFVPRPKLTFQALKYIQGELTVLIVSSDASVEKDAGGRRDWVATLNLGRLGGLEEVVVPGRKRKSTNR